MKNRIFSHSLLALFSLTATGFGAGNQTWDGGATGTGTAWLTIGNWIGDAAYAGVTGSSGNTDIATISAGTGTSVGINMNTAGGNFSLGALDWNRTTAASMLNSSTTAGVLRLNGATVNSVANTLVSLTGATDLTIGGSNTLGLALGNANGIFFVDTNRTLTNHSNSVISSVVSGNALTKTGAGTLVLNGNNTFDGGLTINSGRVELGHHNGAGAGSITLGGTDAFLQTNAGVNAGNAITVSNNGDLKSLRHFSSTNAGTFSGNITINESTSGNFNTNIGASAQLTLGGAIGGTGGAGLSKIGAGTLVISGANTYSGLLRANNGTTTLSGTGSMDAIGMTIGSANSATVNLDDNSVFGIDVVGLGATSILSAASGTGSATLNLNGDFLFDLSLADLTNGNIWQIVDNANIVETYGSTFNVTGFTEASNVWTKVDGNNTWTFTENSGQLSLAVIPEPGAALLGGLGVLALLRRRR